MQFINDTSSVLNSTGKARKAQGQSLSSFLASLATSLIICALSIIINVTFKPKLLKAYYAGTHLTITLARQTTATWPRMMFFPMQIPNSDQMVGLENYLFDRYIHTILRIFIILSVTLTPVLLPLNFLGGKNESGGVKRLDRLSFANVGLLQLNRYWVHLLAAVFVVVFVSLTLQSELQSYSKFKEASDTEQEKGSTILLTSTSVELSSESIQQYLGGVSGGIQTIQINRDYGNIYRKIQQRENWIKALEVAETYLIRKAQRHKGRNMHITRAATRYQNSWRQYLSAEDRPSMRLPIWSIRIPFIGRKVDAIDYCRAEVIHQSHAIEVHQHTCLLSNSAFVDFNLRMSTPLPPLALKHRIPRSWAIHQGTIPSDVIWSSLSISWWERSIRTISVYCIIIFLIVALGLPVTITGCISQLSYLTSVVPGLSALDRLPGWLLGVIQGVLPPTILAIVTSITPAILRILANVQGCYSRQTVEATIHAYYFVFLFVQIFLVVSLSASMTTVIEQLMSQAETIPVILVQNIPKASNYFFSYLIIYTSATVTSTLPLSKKLMNALVSPLLDKSPRQMWMRREELYLQRWGTFIPIYTNLACIGIIYSVIAPLILGISTMAFGTFWFLYRRYPPMLSNIPNGRGQFYPSALRQVFVGLYFMELSLAGLFFLVRDADGGTACTGQAIIMILMTIFTLVFHHSIDHRGRLGWRLAFCNLQKRTSARYRGAKEGACRTNDKMQKSRAVLTDTHIQSRPIIWVPHDSLGIGMNEVDYMKRKSKHLAASTKGAYLDKEGTIILRSGPPDQLS